MAQPSLLPWWHAKPLDVPPWKPENVCMQGTVYWAAEGQGAYVQQPGSEAQRLQAAEVDLSASGLVVVGSASHLTAETQARQRAWLGNRVDVHANGSNDSNSLPVFIPNIPTAHVLRFLPTRLAGWGRQRLLSDPLQEFVAQLKEPAFKQLGSSLKLLMVRCR